MKNTNRTLIALTCFVSSLAGAGCEIVAGLSDKEFTTSATTTNGASSSTGSTGSGGNSACAGGATCQGDSCCETITVPGGVFPMGRSHDGTDAYDEQPEHDVTLSGFALDRYEVTVGRFRQFVAAYAGPPNASDGEHPLIAGSGWQADWDSRLPADQAELIADLKCDPDGQTWTDSPGANEASAINCIDWYTAFAFCEWDGGRLPTEAEWEYAAAGGSENRRYPWGPASPAVGLANYSDNDSAALPVGSFAGGRGRWLHEDLAGGVQEWTLDWYEPGWYAGPGNNCADCANLDAAYGRSVRGGSWTDESTSVRAANRRRRSPTTRDDETGFRCARATASDGSGEPSCAQGLTCQTDSCCRSDQVVGGEFPMGRSESAEDAQARANDEYPEHDVSVSEFSMDRFEVTVGRFRSFVENYDSLRPAAGDGANPVVAGSGWNATWDAELPDSRQALEAALACSESDSTWTAEPGDNESTAINCVSWYEAFAFCASQGLRLPTEAEWERAAAGGSENRLYPWGSTAPAAGRANFFRGASTVGLVAAGSFPLSQGRWGHDDLAGGVREWVFDGYLAEWYAGSGYLCSDCARPPGGFYHVNRGGSWGSTADVINAANRSSELADQRSAYLGFRCVGPAVTNATPAEVVLPPGPASWAVHLGGSGTEVPFGIALDGSDNLFVVGETLGQFDLMGATLGGAGESDGFVLKRDGSGAHTWAVGIGGVGDEVPFEIATDPNGDVAILMMVDGTPSLDLGCGPISFDGSVRELVIAKLSGANGACQWSRNIGPGRFYGDLSVDGSGNVFVVGAMQGDLDFGGGNTLTFMGPDTDAFVAKLDADGVHQWSRAFSGGEETWGSDIALIGSGGVEVIIGGSTRSPSIDFGTGALTGGPDWNTFLVGIDAAGVTVWSKRYGGDAYNASRGLVATPDGNVASVVRFRDKLELGMGLSLLSPGHADLAVLKLSPTGDLVWSNSVGSPYDDSGEDVAVDPQGNVLVAGDFRYRANFGGADFFARYESSFIVKLSGTNGAHLWSHGFGDGTGSRGVAAASNGDIVFASDFLGEVRPGEDLLTSAGSWDVFFGRIPAP